MVARFNRFRVIPADMPATVQFGRDVYLPGSTAQEGFRGLFACFNNEGQWFVVELYDTIEQVRATETQGWYQEMAEAFGLERVQGQVRRNIYEVAISEGLKGTD